MFEHCAWKQVSETFHQTRVRTDYGNKMLQYVEPVPWYCISNKIKYYHGKRCPLK